MKPAIRNISSIFCMMAGLFPILLILVFTLNQHSTRHHMIEKMEKEVLHSLIIADQEIQWIKAGKEIWVDGKMFDIKKTEHKDGKTIFYGLFDHEETLLKQQFNTTWEKNQFQKNQIVGQLFQTFQGIYFNNENNSLIQLNGYLRQFNPNNSKLTSQFLETPTPPPLT